MKKIICLVILMLIMSACNVESASEDDLESILYEESELSSNSSTIMTEEEIGSTAEEIVVDVQNSESSEQEAEEPTQYQSLAEILDEFGKDGYVYTYWSRPREDADLLLLEDWISAYQKGESATVVIYYDGAGFPSGVIILESDGSNQYTITRYWEKIEFPDNDLVVKVKTPDVDIGTMVVKREFDYVFELGVRDEFNSPLFIHRKPYTGDGEDHWYDTEEGYPYVKDITKFDISSVPILGTTTPEMALEIAIEKTKKFIGSSIGYNWSREGARFLEDTLGDIEVDKYYKEHELIIIDSVDILGHPCYVFRSNITGFLAVNADGGNLLLINYNDWWTLLDDDNEVIITPN